MDSARRGHDELVVFLHALVDGRVQPVKVARRRALNQLQVRGLLDVQAVEGKVRPESRRCGKLDTTYRLAGGTKPNSATASLKSSSEGV